MKESYGEGLGAAMLAAVPAGEGPAGGTCPVAAVAISGDGKGDRPVESPDVKASVVRAQCPDRSVREANNSAGRSGKRTSPDNSRERTYAKAPVWYEALGNSAKPTSEAFA